MEVFAVGTAVLNLYMAVEFHSISALAMAVGVTAAFCWGAGEMTAVYETSWDVMETRKGPEHVGQSVWFRKFLRSCKPIRIPLGSLFYID